MRLQAALLLVLFSEAASNSISSMDLSPYADGSLYSDSSKGYAWYNTFGHSGACFVTSPSYRNTKYIVFPYSGAGLHQGATF